MLVTNPNPTIKINLSRIKFFTNLNFNSIFLFYFKYIKMIKFK